MLPQQRMVVWDRAAGSFLLRALHAKVYGSWNKQIETLIYARGRRPRLRLRQSQGRGGKSLHSPARQQRRATAATFQQGSPWLHKRNLRGSRLQRRRGRGVVVYTARHTNLATSCIGRPRRSESSSVPRDLDTSGDHTSIALPYPSMPLHPYLV
jgi:hypothetical protein